MKGAGALLFAIVFILHCSLSAATPFSSESAIVAVDKTDQNRVKGTEEIQKPVEPAFEGAGEIKKPVESALEGAGEIKKPVESALEGAGEIKKPVEPAFEGAGEIKKPVEPALEGAKKIKEPIEPASEEPGKIKKPVEPVAVGPRWIFPSELQPWPKFILRPRQVFARNVESGPFMDGFPNVGQKSTHIDLDIVDENVDRALDKASQILNRMKNAIKNDDGFFFLKQLSRRAENQHSAPRQVKDFLPLVNKMEETIKKLTDVSVEHKEGRISSKHSFQLKHDEEHHGFPKLSKRVKILEDTVHFLTWIVLILVFTLLFVCVASFIWISCRMSSQVKDFGKSEKCMKLAIGAGIGPRGSHRSAIVPTFRI